MTANASEVTDRCCFMTLTPIVTGKMNGGDYEAFSDFPNFSPAWQVFRF